MRLTSKESIKTLGKSIEKLKQANLRETAIEKDREATQNFSLVPGVGKVVSGSRISPYQWEDFSKQNFATKNSDQLKLRQAFHDLSK